MLNFWFLLLLCFLNFGATSVTHSSISNDENYLNDKREPRIVGCPHEFFPDTAITRRKSYFEVGKVVTLKCDSKRSDWRDCCAIVHVQLVQFPYKLLFVFPTLNRTCLPNGIRTPSPPLCIKNTEGSNQSQRIEERPAGMIRATLELRSWRKDRLLRSTCKGTICKNRVIRNRGAKTYNILYGTCPSSWRSQAYCDRRGRHATSLLQYPSFVTIKLSRDLLDFSVFAKEKGRISLILPVATLHFQAASFDECVNINPPQHCIITELFTYIKQLMCFLTQLLILLLLIILSAQSKTVSVIMMLWYSGLCVPKSYGSSDLISPISADRGLEWADQCPTEYYHNIKPMLQRKDYQDINHTKGKEMTLECSNDDEFHKSRQSDFMHEYFIYPSPNRTCQPSGTWSGVPPLCVWEPSHHSRISTTQHLLPKGEFCSDSTECSTQTWRRIGRLHPSCSENLGFSNVEFEEFQVFFELNQHVHLSFMTFQLAGIDGPIRRPFRVEVSVPEEDVILFMSEKSTQYLKDHYIPNAISKQTCAIVELSAYTRRVLVRFSAADTTNAYSLKKKWIPAPLFYPVLELGSKTEDRIVRSKGCPKPPLIPNASMQQMNSSGSRGNFRQIIYTCKLGYSMINPVTNANSSGMIECRNGFEWEPYPFPVCVTEHVAYNYSQVKTFSANQDIEHSSKSEIQSTVFPSNQTTLTMEATLTLPTSIIFNSHSAESEIRSTVFPNNQTTLTIEAIFTTPTTVIFNTNSSETDNDQQQVTLGRETHGKAIDSGIIYVVAMSNLAGLVLTIGIIIAFFVISRKAWLSEVCYRKRCKLSRNLSRSGSYIYPSTLHFQPDNLNPDAVITHVLISSSSEDHEYQEID